MRVIKHREGGVVRRVVLLDDVGDEVVPVTRFLSHLTDSNCSPNKMAVKMSSPAVQRITAQTATMLKQLQSSPAFKEFTAALDNTGTGRRPVDMQRDTDALIDPGMAPEPLAAIAALIVLALPVGFWLDQASKCGPDFAVANRFDLLESGDFIVGCTVGAYAVAVRVLRRILNQPGPDKH